MVGRGPYAKPDYKTKAKIMAKYRDGLNWKETAKDSGVSFRTVRAWVANPNKDVNGVPMCRPRGGSRNVKIRQQYKDVIQELLSNNCLLTAKEVTWESHRRFTGLQVSSATVSKAMHGLC